MKALKYIQTRTYVWNDELAVRIKGVTHVKVKKDIHYLKTMDGKQHVITEGWVHLEIITKDGAI